MIYINVLSKGINDFPDQDDGTPIEAIITIIDTKGSKHSEKIIFVNSRQ